MKNYEIENMNNLKFVITYGASEFSALDYYDARDFAQSLLVRGDTFDKATIWIAEGENPEKSEFEMLATIRANNNTRFWLFPISATCKFDNDSRLRTMQRHAIASAIEHNDYLSSSAKEIAISRIA